VSLSLETVLLGVGEAVQNLAALHPGKGQSASWPKEHEALQY
jgi:hypothetical protein